MSDRTDHLQPILAEIETAWRALNLAVDQLSVTQTAALKDSQGWSVKDQLYHLMAWENSVIFFLRGERRSDGLGISEELFLHGGADEINSAIFELGKTSSLYEVRVQHQIIHNRLMGLLSALDDAELDKPYAHFLTDPTGDMRAARQVLLSNTVHHYAEHLEWIRKLLESQSEPPES